MEDFVYSKNDWEWRATAGMDERRFLLLLEIFEAAYVSEVDRNFPPPIPPKTPIFTTQKEPDRSCNGHP